MRLTVLLSGLVILGLAACGGSPVPATGTTASGASTRAAPAPSLSRQTVHGQGPSRPAALDPATAVEIGRELYMVPAGRDESGCTRYNLVARQRETVQAIFYRDAHGDFTTNKADAGCL